MVTTVNGTQGVDNIQDNTITTDDIQDGAITAAKIANSYAGMKNLIINGNMQIAQRGTSFNVNGANTKYTVDRFALGLTEGDFTATQDTDIPTGQGFASSLKIDNNSAIATLAVGTQNFFEQKIEAQNLTQLSYGTANAKTITLSFWVKSNKTGTYIVWLYAPSGGNMISNSYTISSANTWEKKTIAIVGDTSSLAFANNNGIGLYVRFMIGAGSNYQASPLATSWTPITSPTRYQGQVNLADSTSNYINITGVQLEAGTTATDFERLQYGQQLELCQRYCYKIGGDSAYTPFAMGTSYNTVGGNALVNYPVAMRATPTMTPTYPIRSLNGGSTQAVSSVSFGQGGATTAYIDYQTVSTTSGQAVMLTADGNTASNLLFSAEL